MELSIYMQTTSSFLSVVYFYLYEFPEQEYPLRLTCPEFYIDVNPHLYDKTIQGSWSNRRTFCLLLSGLYVAFTGFRLFTRNRLF